MAGKEGSCYVDRNSNKRYNSACRLICPTESNRLCKQYVHSLGPEGLAMGSVGAARGLREITCTRLLALVKKWQVIPKI